jgi:hypothetical protein
VLLDALVGTRFWLGMVAMIVVIGIGVGIAFLLVSAALFAWGIFGSLVAFAAIALGIAWFYDRRKQAEYDSYD